MLTAKVASVVPAAKIAVAGTEAQGELLLSWTIKPPTGAGLPILTIPVAVVPPVTVVGLKAKEVGGASPLVLHIA